MSVDFIHWSLGTTQFFQLGKSEDYGRCGKWKRKTGEEMNTMAKSPSLPVPSHPFSQENSSLEWMNTWIFVGGCAFLFEEMRSDSETPGHLTISDLLNSTGNYHE